MHGADATPRLAAGSFGAGVVLGAGGAAFGPTARRLSSVTPEQQLADFLARFLPEIRELAEGALDRMRARLPGAIEMVYDNYNALVIGFGPTGRPSEALFSIAVYPRYVSLCFLTGADLTDSDGILRGDGKVVRHVRLEDPGRIDSPTISALMDEAIERGLPWGPAREGRLVIRSISAKQRPRRPAA
jgi:Domain of unknown function (DU1801)